MIIEIQDSGRVFLVDPSIGQGIVEPHDEYTLDQLAPDLDAADRQRIMDKWATIPLPPPPVVPPPIDPTTTSITLEDVERLILENVPGMSRDKINQAKNDRGKSIV